MRSAFHLNIDAFKDISFSHSLVNFKNKSDSFFNGSMSTNTAAAERIALQRGELIASEHTTPPPIILHSSFAVFVSSDSPNMP